MDRLLLVLLALVLTPLYVSAWRTSSEERRHTREIRRGGVHYHAKRHMLPNDHQDPRKRNQPSQKNRDIRKKVNIKPSGHLAPLKEDDIDNDEVVSVAIGPPPMRPMYDKLSWKHGAKASSHNNSRGKEIAHNCTHGTANMVKDVLTQLGRELMTNQVSEDFVFGQYVGYAMRNMTSDLKLKMQHEVLELVIKYQKLSRGEEVMTPKPEDKSSVVIFSGSKKTNDTTEDAWPDFSNLAKIVG